jgi:hypothetical protein
MRARRRHSSGAEVRLALSSICRFAVKVGNVGPLMLVLVVCRRAQSVASRSVIHPTRLETRTKESNMCASHSVLFRLERRNESNFLRCDPRSLRRRGAATARLFRLLTVWRSCSVHVGTRKMVNYAWARRSQRKLWWRSVAILTCKSIVRPGYRGERLIEPSSSWFPLKFPSG